MRSFYASVIRSLLSLWVVTAINAQETKRTEPIFTNDNNCEPNKSYFDYLAVGAGKEGSVCNPPMFRTTHK